MSDGPMIPGSFEEGEQTDDLGRRLAEQLIEKLDLVGTIRSWNADQYAMLASLEHVRYSVIYDDARLDAFDATVDEAEARGVGPEFRNSLALLLDPILVSTTVAGVTTRCLDWAVHLLEGGPVINKAPAPFPSDEAMITWLLRHVRGPGFAGPTGEEIIEDSAEELLLTQALRAELRLAVRKGWLRR